MAIGTGRTIKGVQEVILPGSVVTNNVFYWLTDFQEEQDEADIVDAVETRVDSIYTQLDDHIVDGCTMGDLYVYVYDSIDLEWDLIGTGSPAVSFAATGDMLPHGVSLVLRAYTTDPRVIARKYFGGFDEAVCGEGVWNSTVQTAALTAGTSWGTNAQIDANNVLKPAVFSNAGYGTQELNDDFVVLTHCGYQRRRRPGVGV